MSQSAAKPAPLYRHDLLDRQQIREVAAKGGVDEKTVVKYLRIRDGGPPAKDLKMVSTTRSRVEYALRACGHAELVIGATSAG